MGSQDPQTQTKSSHASLGEVVATGPKTRTPEGGSVHLTKTGHPLWLWLARNSDPSSCFYLWSALGLKVCSGLAFRN